MRTGSIGFVFLLLACISSAQQVPQSSGASPDKLTVPPVDFAKLKSGLNGSYYHPDDLTGIDCSATVDWASVMKQLNKPAPEDRLKILDSMLVTVHARRGKIAEVTFSWPAGELSNRQMIEDTDRQMLYGFFMIYWSGLAAPFGPLAKEWKTARAEPRPGGGYILHYVDGGVPITEEIDDDFLPVKAIVSISAASTTEMTMHYSQPQELHPGDMRRVTSIATKQTLGTSVTNVTIGIAYQQMAGYWIPSHFDTTIEGAYTVPIDLIGCSVSKDLTVLPPPAVPKSSSAQ